MLFRFVYYVVLRGLIVAN